MDNPVVGKGISGAISACAEAAKSWTDTPFPYLLGMGLMVALATLASKWDGHIYNREGCVRLQVIEKQAFKVDTCSGHVEKFDVKK